MNILSLPELTVNATPEKTFFIPSSTAIVTPLDDGKPDDVSNLILLPTINPTERPLIIKVGSQSYAVVPSALEGEEGNNYWRSILQEAEVHPVISLENLLSWEHEERWRVLLFLGQLERPYCFYALEENEEPKDLLEVVLTFFDEKLDVKSLERARRGALEAAAIIYPHELTLACNRIAKRLQEIHITGYTAAKLEKEAQVYVTAAHVQNNEEEAGDTGLISVLEVFPDAQVPEETLVPPKWELASGGIFQPREDESELILPTPLLITRRLSDIHNNNECMEIAWHRDADWQTQIVARSKLFASRSIVELADYGLPVTSNNAAQVVQYLADYETVNLERLPRSLVSQQLGWLGEHGFLWGTELISPPLTLADAVDESGHFAVSHEVAFRGSDTGDNQLAEGFRAEGSMEGWQAAVKPAADYPRIKLAVYAALSTPLLSLVDAPNFILSFAGATSQGKTTALRVAASCWGCPDERSPQAVIGTWDATRVWIERAAAVQNDLPLILDDTKRARRAEDIAQTIYDVTSGRSRGRGSVDGTRSALTFRTILLASGEAPIISFSQDGGTRARVLEIWGSPFENTNAAAIVNALNDGVRGNFGHVGPQFIRFLLDHQSQWLDFSDRYRNFRQSYEKLAVENPAASRMASHFALLEMTAALLQEARLSPWEHEEDFFKKLWPELTAASEEADRATAALRHVMSWANSHLDEFWRISKASSSQPHGGWAGRWAEGERDVKTAYVGFFPHKLDEILENGEFEPEPIRRLWYDRGWLLTSPSRRQLRVRIGELTYLVAIKLQAIRELEGLEEEGEPRLPVIQNPFGLL